MPDLSSVHCCPTISDADTDILRRIDRYLLRANDHIEDTNEAELIAAAALSKTYSVLLSRGAVTSGVVVDMICGTENVLCSTMRQKYMRDQLMTLHNGVALDQQAFAEMVSSIWAHLCDLNYPAFVAKLSTTNEVRPSNPEVRSANSHAAPAASNNDAGISSAGRPGLKENRIDKNRRDDTEDKRSNKWHDFEKGPNKRPHIDYESDEGRENSGVGQYQLPCIEDASECIGKDPNISNLVRRIESHDRYICARCYTKFDSLTEKHQHGTKCEKQCVLSDCMQSPPHGSDSSSIRAIKHKEAEGCPPRKGKASQIWRYIYAMCHPDSEAVPDPVIIRGDTKAHIAPAATLGPFVRRQCRSRLQESEEVRPMLQDSRNRIALLEERLERARVESDAVLKIERAQFTLQTTQSDCKIKTLQGLLRLCRGYVPPGELRRQVDEACPLLPTTTTNPALMQHAADNIVPQVCPNTPQPTLYSTTTSLWHEPRIPEQHMFGPPTQFRVGRIAQTENQLRDKSHSMPLNTSGTTTEQIDGTNNISAEELADFFSGPSASDMGIFNNFTGGMNDQVW
ncbi:hypothetical protein CKM354_000604600 [Cercospora kikuchii]|uniref:Uncharacterized protein n=1 Tax=Cercospora kikuchii TaxID=84275 RepID=A0A9P3CHE4_9PEZI|nr:uncharacterized protein CKM354_000604600 [Cercospora kikuchii]GIZ42791.1 hypothetical protein CKM354_000604600 [Cercospora kikuchii]